MSLKSKIAGAIRTVYNAAKGSMLNEAFYFVMSEDIKMLEDYFDCDYRQAALLSIIISNSCRGRSTDSSDIIGYTQIEPLQILEYSSSLIELTQKNLISRSSARHRSQQSILSDSYSVNAIVVRYIQNGNSLPTLTHAKYESNLGFLEAVSELGNNSEGWEQEDLTDVQKEFKNIIESNYHLSFVKRFKALRIPNEDFYLLCETTWKLLNGSISVGVGEIIDKFFKRKLDRVQYTQALLKGSIKVIEEGLVKITDEDFYHSPVVKPTDRYIKLMEQEGIMIPTTSQVEAKNVITPDKIVKKELFYNSEELKQIELLTDCLTDTGFRRTQKKLLANGMTPGITGLLYGPPGTGKTELVYQIARKTGRDIIPIDCTAIRDKFFGASESKLNEVFRNYEAYCATASRAAILMLNEGDQLLGKRRNVSGDSHSITQTENNLVNLLLENLERNKNIILITSNMPQNMDFAAQRRILFRISIQPGSPEIQAKIWMSRMKNLPDELCEKLSHYNLSGGSIENIIRKYILNSVLNKDDNLNNLLEYAKQESETWGENRPQIGFK